MSRRSLTVGVIGIGFGRAHIPAFQAAGCSVVAVCQRDEVAARKVASAYGVTGVFTRWEDMLEKARPEIVSIATPPHLHLPIATAAFEMGAHVLCEKPLAMTRAEAQTMVEAARRAARVAMTSFNWRSPAAMQQLHRLIGEGAVGRVFHVMGRWLGNRWVDESVKPTWRMDRAQAGHGAMGDMGVHFIDLVRWNVGEFKRVAAQAGVAYPSRTVPGGARPADAEDYCTLIAELASGAQVSATVSRVARGSGGSALEIYGSDGALSYRLGRQGPRWFEGELHSASGDAMLSPVTLRNVPPPSVGEGDRSDQVGKVTIAPLVEKLLEGIRTGTSPSPSFEDGMKAQAVLDAVLESISRGGWVTVAG